jgi:hypothetical protein
MLWECTVCTNHFDGDGPPDYCSSCGSPREYFTAYHFYGLKTPSEPPADTASRVQRPSYTESSITDLTCFRFHKKKYFHAEPQEFYRNFLEARHTFVNPYRFAGAGFNSGFYFATTAESAIAEMIFYSDISPDETPSEPQAVLRKLRSLGDDRAFLEVTLSLKRVADLTDPIVLEYFLREGPARATFQPSGVPYSLLRAIATSGRGGSKHTDGIGHFAFSNGWTAVKFPSVRALSAMWGIENLTRHDVLSKLPENHPRAMNGSVEDHLRSQANLVVFSGSLLTRSVARYAWTDVEGTRTTAENPFHAVDARMLEAARITFREQNALTAMEAAKAGYLSDEEIVDEYKTDTWWVAKSERI